MCCVEVVVLVTVVVVIMVCRVGAAAVAVVAFLGCRGDGGLVLGEDGGGLVSLVRDDEPPIEPVGDRSVRVICYSREKKEISFHGT